MLKTIQITWDDLKSRLTDKVISLMKVPDLGEQWLDGLDRCDDGLRLGLCIAIDVEGRALAPQTFADILDLMLAADIDYDARSAFGKAILRYPDYEGLICLTSFPSVNLDDDDAYLRILDLEAFVDRYASTSAPRSPGRAGTIEVRDSYFGPTSTSTFMDLDSTWSGANGRVWVVPLRFYSKFKAQIANNTLGTAINDALGLGKPELDSNNEPTELVAVQYPKTFITDLGIVCSQPTTLDSEWRKSGWYYLSYHRGTSRDYPGWGRTQSCSGNSQPFPEKVHRWVAELTDDFRGFIIDQVKELNPDRSKLIEEGFLRLSVVW